MLATPSVANAILSGDQAHLEAITIAEFRTLKGADPVVSTLEVTDSKGIVLIRGHNPKTFGDNKSHLKEIIAAMAGRTTLGLTVSPASGQAAVDVVAPVVANNNVVGTLKIGAYATVQLAEEVKQKRGAEIVTVFRGKITASTLPKNTKIEIAPEILGSAIGGAAQTTAFSMAMFRAWRSFAI